MAGRKERVVLNPVEVAVEDRIEIDLHSGAIKIGEEGIDWGDSAIEAYMAKGSMGSRPIDSDLPNRVIAIPLTLGATGDFDAARVSLQAEIGRTREEGGTLKRELIGGSYGEAGAHLFADIVKATLKLSGGTEQASTGFDPEAELILETLPDFYGDPIALAAFEGTGDASSTFQIKGNQPGRVDLTATDMSGNDQLGLGWCSRCRNYSADESAAWAYEAEELTPLDSASITALSGASGGNAVVHASLGTGWTPVLSMNRLPKVRAVGATAAGTGAVKPPLPTGIKENDVLVMYIETENQAVAVPAGWAHVTGSPVEVASGTTTRLTVLWKRAGASETAPTIEDPGDHVIARILAVSGCIKTGNPWNKTAVETELVSDTTVSVPTVSTTIDGCLVLAAVSTGTDVSSTTHVSAWTNTNLQSLTERMDSWTAEGGGGGFGVVSGIKLKAGAVGATTATVVTANFKALMTIALKPETGGNYLTHAGTYDVWARVYTTSGSLPWLRFVYDVGDLVAPEETVQVRVQGANNFYLVPLGQINLRKAPFGDHRWSGAIQSRGLAGGEEINIDRLYFFCADEASGILKAPRGYGVPLAGCVARDAFFQTEGALTGKTAEVSAKAYAAITGSDPDDFTIVAGSTHKVKRTAVSDSGTISSTFTGRAVGLALGLADIMAEITFNWSRYGSFFTSGGLLLRASSASNYVRVFYSANHGAESESNAGGIGIEVVRGGVLTVFGWEELGPRRLSGKLTAGVIGDEIAVFLDDARIPLKTNTNAGLPMGTDKLSLLPSGGVYLADECQEAAAMTREYDNLAAWVPDKDAVLFSGRNALISNQGMFRQDPTGAAYGPVAYPGSDLPRIPVSGPEGRPVEICLKPSRGDFESIPDSALDAIQGGGSYRPCWSGVPEP